jgi:glycosyltransferase involved in cell wall biosynthesis
MIGVERRHSRPNVPILTTACMIIAHESHRRPRVLQLSYACSPVRGSEAGVGWHRAVQSAKHFDTWVICEEHEFADEIRGHLKTHGDIPGLHFVFVPISQREWSWGQIHDSIWYAVLRRWHRVAFQTAQRLHAQIGFDLAHQVTFCGYREPGYLWKLGVPFVWGPIGGTQNYPWRFLASAGVRGAIHESCRSLLNNMQLRFSPRVRAAGRNAAIVLAANTTIQRDIARNHGVVPDVLLETGLATVQGVPRRRSAEAGPLRILWSGQLTHGKALHLLIAALARLPSDIRYELRILGSGRLKSRWERLANRLGVSPHIAWLGWLPYEEALRQYAWADVLAFTSLRDTSGNVVLEALAAGVPVVCFDHQGVHDIVTDQCGIRIPVTTPREGVARWSDTITQLARDAAFWERLSGGAIQRAHDYLWSRQDGQMAELYYQALGGEHRSLSPGQNQAGGRSPGMCPAAMNIDTDTHISAG